MDILELVGVREAKAHLGKLLSDVEGGKVYQIVKYGRPVAVLVASDRYKALLQELEDLEDALDALQSMQEPSRPLDEFLAEYTPARRVSAGD